MDARYRVEGPACINVSGGRTSGYMLWHILDAHDGKLPADVVPVFANTGREMPATLDFVHAMERAWGVHIQWLEYRRDPDSGRVWTEPVSHNSASRDGEPFRQMLEGKRGMLPGPKMRFCTAELKVKTVNRWLARDLGWRGVFRHCIGLRWDELHRVLRIAKRNASRKERFFGSCPLAKARVTKRGHIAPFWAAQPFDLGLAGDWEGNCDGCFLKRINAIKRMTIDHPERGLEEREMAGSVNKVIIVGTLGRDPELRTTQDGKKIVNLSVATNETWKDRISGERKERAEWHRVVIFNEPLGDVATRYLRKGSKVYLEGQLQTRKWQDQAGQDRYSTEVVLQQYRGELTLLDAREDGVEERHQTRAPAGGGRSGDLDDSIPFGPCFGP